MFEATEWELDESSLSTSCQHVLVKPTKDNVRFQIVFFIVVDEPMTLNMPFRRIINAERGSTFTKNIEKVSAICQSQALPKMSNLINYHNFSSLSLILMQFLAHKKNCTFLRKSLV